jgi:hypothetical protein
MEIVEFVRVNSQLIKDMFTIIFTGTGTVLALLTYRRARATVLQPKRTEVIKRQTDALSNFLSLISKNHNSIGSSLDYVSLFNYNVDLILRDYGFIEIDKESTSYQEYNSNIAGWIQFLDNDVHNYIFVKGSIKDYDQLYFEANDRKRQKTYNTRAIEGQVNVHRIFYTHKHIEFYEGLRDFVNNPFLPNEIHTVANSLAGDIYMNIHSYLKAILKKLIEEYSKALIDKDYPYKIILAPEYRHQELYRVFEKERKKHRAHYDELKNKIREHLMVDGKW